MRPGTRRGRSHESPPPRSCPPLHRQELWYWQLCQVLLLHQAAGAKATGRGRGRGCWGGLVQAMLTASSCRMCSIVASSARVPFVASSSTAFTVFSKDVTLVTMTCQ